MDACSQEIKPLMTVADALARIMACIVPVQETETRRLDSALGRVLAQPLFSPVNIPLDRNSAMDGYAVMTDDFKDGPVPLHIIGSAWAGQPFTGQMQAGQCVRVFTGAVLPASADSVIMQEQVRVEGATACFQGDLKSGQNVRAAGEDVREHTLLLPSGEKLRAGHLALLAAAGMAEVAVLRRLKVIHFSTGDELITAGEPLVTGKVVDSNRYLLQGLLADPAYQVTDGGILKDDLQRMLVRLDAAAHDFDVIITTGGASVGEADYIREVLAHLGRVEFWKIAIKPGKPMAFGRIGGCHFFGLPGNPAAVMVTFQQLLAPALRRLSGQAVGEKIRLRATCTTALKKSPGREEYPRGFLYQDADATLQVRSAGHQGSHSLSSLAAANCLLVLPAECTGVAVGESVVVEPLWTGFQ